MRSLSQNRPSNNNHDYDDDDDDDNNNNNKNSNNNNALSHSPSDSASSTLAAVRDRREDQPSSHGTMEHHRGHFPCLSSNNTSTSTSRHTSTASMFSLINAHQPHSRNPTPPTPTSSPGLYSPPRPPPPSDKAPAAGPHLHPSQYRQPEHKTEVKETYLLDLDFDPVSGRKIVNHYTIIDEIGRGVHGKVKLGTDTETGDLVAIKIIERSQDRPRLGRRDDGESEKKVRREIAILKKCRHENVVRLLEVIDDPQSKKVYLILEYVQLGEIVWREPGDPAVLRRERHRLRQQFGHRAFRLGSSGQDGEGEGEDTWRRRRRRRRRKKCGRFWSLEFASDSGSDDDNERSNHPPRFPRLLPTTSEHLPPIDSDTELLPPSQTLDYSSDSDDCWSSEDLGYVPALSIEQARSTFRETVLGLEYLHYHGIIHRDIKPANLLWTKERLVKISDFGVSFLGRPIRDGDDEFAEGPCYGSEEPTGLEQNELELAKTAGTPAFFAPELCYVDPTSPRPQITGAIDVWALGVTLYCLLFARCPFMADTEFQLLKVIATEEVMIPDRRLRPKDREAERDACIGGPTLPLTPERLLEVETEIIDVDLKDLLKRLLTKDPAKRITLKEVKRHPWVLTGVLDPCNWVEDTDPERMSDGNKIEVTVEDVEKAVSSAGVLGRARSAVKRAVEWGKGLRRRASSTANVLSTSKADKDKGRKSESAESAPTKPCLSGRMVDEEEGELRWMGSNPSWRDDDRSQLSIGSAVCANSFDTCGYGGESSPGPSSPRRSGSEYQRFQRKSSSSLSGPAMGHHAPTGSDPSGVGGCFRPAPGGFPCAGASESPQVSKSDTSLRTPGRGHSHAGSLIGNGMRRVVRSMRSGGFSDGGDKVKGPASREGSPFRPRDSFAGALRGDHSFYAYGNGQLHVQFPNVRRHSYAGIDVGGSPLEVVRPGRTDSRSRLEGDVVARFAAFTMKDKQHPASPDDEASMDKVWERDQQKALRRHEVAKENYYPTQDSPTRPIMMERRSHGFFDHLALNSSQPAQLVSSSSEEQFATTAGSSLTNSTSFPSIMSEPSSVSSEFSNSRYSRKSSIAGPVHEEEFGDDYRPPTPFHQSSRLSNLRQIDIGMDADLDDDDDDGDESDGGFVMEVPPLKKKSSAGADSVKVVPCTRRRGRSSVGSVPTVVKDKKPRRGRSAEEQ